MVTPFARSKSLDMLTNIFCFYPGFSLGNLQMVLIPEVGNKLNRLQLMNFICLCRVSISSQIQVKYKHAVMEPVRLWRQSVMHYTGFIEAGIHAIIKIRFKPAVG